MTTAIRPPKTLTGDVAVVCGCLGAALTSGTKLTGANPVVYIRITVPCDGTHDRHSTRVGAGVIDRFLPELVRQVEVTLT